MKNYNETDFQKSLINMNYNEFTVHLNKRFSNIFNGDVVASSCGSGWNPLLWELFEKIEVIAVPYNLKIKILQIKEKFGSLRFYYNAIHECEGSTQATIAAITLIDDIVNNYEEKSYHICDVSGRYYKYRIESGSWYYACCYEAYVKSRAEDRVAIENARKKMVTQIQFDTIIDNVKRNNKMREFITSLYQTGVLNEYLDDKLISKLVENEFWLDLSSL